jgi:hypothetical protein
MISRIKQIDNQDGVLENRNLGRRNKKAQMQELCSPDKVSE